MEKRKLSSRTASFIKVFEDNFTDKVPIPLAFANIFEGDIPPWFILETAGSRKCWRVDVEHDGNGGLCLGYGFDCFAKEHYLEVGNFLLFEHEKPSILQVKIYEKDGSERIVGSIFEPEYKIRASESLGQTPIIHEGRLSTSPRQTPIVHESRHTPIIHEGRDSESPRQTPIIHEGEFFEFPRQTPIIHEVGPCEFLRDFMEVHQEQEATPWPTMPSVPYRSNEMQQNPIDKTQRKKCLVSPTEHGLCFSLTWRKANHFLYYLTIPRAILVGKTFPNKEKILLKDKEGNCWPMELRLRPDGRVDLARGWKDFVSDNDLSTGDELTFEFVSNNMVQVQIVRAFQVDNPCQREQDIKIEHSEHSNMTCQNVELAGNFNPDTIPSVTEGKLERVASESKSSSFSLTWTQKTRYSHLHIPKAIANKQKLENKDKVVVCDPEGRQWSTEVRTRRSDGRVGLGRGWNEFLRAHEIGPGDTLFFEFVTDRVIKIHMIKACELHPPVAAAMVKQEVLTLD